MAATTLQWSEKPLLHSVGHLLDMLPAALFVHAFLAFPTGRLAARPERIVVIACYVTTLGLKLVKILLGVKPASLFVAWSAPGWGSLVEGVQLGVVAGVV